MSWRVVVARKDAHLSLRLGRLFIDGKDSSESVPIEDIDTLLVENDRTSLSVKLLVTLAENGVSVLLSDKQQLPACIVTPTARHSRQLESLRVIDALGRPFAKRVWKQIIIRKILNQACVAGHFGLPDTKTKLQRLTRRVKSGDTGNIESVAAAIYFRALWPTGRRVDNTHNAMANYGYAIVRSSLARHLVGFGFSTPFGLKHQSAQNPFNLADDLLEPFRPIIDKVVLENLGQTIAGKGLAPELKNTMILALTQEVSLSGSRSGETCI